MSQAESGDSTVDRTINKTVQIVGYLSDQSYDDWREYVDDNDDDVDYYEKEERSSTEYFLTGFGERIKISKEQYEKFSQQNIGLMSLDKKVDKHSSFIHRPESYVNSVRDTIIEALMSDIEGEFFQGNFWKSKLSHANSDCTVKFHSYTDVLGMLKHQSEATEDDMFEDKEKRMAMKFKIQIKDASPEVLEYIDENVIQGFIKVLSKSDEIEKTRIYDCEVDTTEKGVCFNI